MGDTLTVYACIGNSDDKLTQARWSAFHRKFVALIRANASTIYGEWASASSSPWQNACVAFEIDPVEAQALRHLLSLLAGEYGQDSISWAVAATTFLTPAAETAPRTIADDILDYCHANPWPDEPVAYGSLTLCRDTDGTVRIVDAPDIMAVDIDLLGAEQLANVSFIDGILTVDAEPAPVRYRPLYIHDFGMRVVFARENQQPLPKSHAQP